MHAYHHVRGSSSRAIKKSEQDGPREEEEGEGGGGGGGGGGSFSSWVRRRRRRDPSLGIFLLLLLFLFSATSSSTSFNGGRRGRQAQNPPRDKLIMLSHLARRKKVSLFLSLAAFFPQIFLRHEGEEGGIMSKLQYGGVFLEKGRGELILFFLERYNQEVHPGNFAFALGGKTKNLFIAFCANRRERPVSFFFFFAVFIVLFGRPPPRRHPFSLLVH